MMNEPYIYIDLNERGFLYLRFDKSFRNKNWAENYGEVQRILSNCTLNGFEYRGIIIDFTYCEWVDPLPLLSLLISLHEYKELNDKKHYFLFLPHTSTKQRKTLKVVKFLINEGFLQQFKQIVDNNIFYYLDNNPKKYKKVDDKYFEDLDKIDVNLYYSNSTLIHGEVIDLTTWGNDEVDFELWIKEKIKRISAKLSGDFYNENDLDNIIYKLKNFYSETLNNIKKHAYSADEKQFAGVYTRLRYGLRNNSLTEEIKKKIYDATFTEEIGEKDHCPRLSTDYIETNNYFIEVFVIDSGIGFVNSLKDKVEEELKINKFLERPFPFRIACDLVFKKGQRKSSRQYIDSKSKFGGLFHIGKLLMDNNDYLCGRDYNEWVGDYLPFILERSYNSINLTDNKRPVNGLAWIARLTPTNYSYEDTENWVSWNGAIKQHPFHKVINVKHFDESRLNNFKILDYRFYKNGENEFFNNYSFTKHKTYEFDYFIVYSKKNLTKHGVWDFLFEIYKQNKFRSRKNIIIVGIAERDKNSYLSALDSSEFRKLDIDHWSKYISTIVLITQSLSVCLIRPEESNHVIKFNREEKESNNLFDNDNNDLSLFNILGIIRFYDSYNIWHTIFSKTSNGFNEIYTNGLIEWNYNEKINGYIDFSRLLAIKEVKLLLNSALVKWNGIFSTKISKFINIDILTKSFCDEYNSNNAFIQNTDTNKSYVGSIYVTGDKLKDALWDLDELNNVLNVHFFLHTSSKTIIPHLFLWFDPLWPFIRENMPNKVENYKRVGKTHVISEHGFKYYTIERYNSKGEPIFYCSPKESYSDFQSIEKKFIKVGNYNYNGYPDLFKFDIKRAVSLSFEFKEPLSQFLVSEFFLSLGGTKKEQLSPEIADFYWDTIEEKLIDKEYYENIELIIYPSQINTNFAIEKIKECMDDELSKRIIPITNINYYKKSNSFIMSQNNEILLKKYLKNDNSEVLYFDCTLVSGRTRKEIKSVLLNTIGFKEVKTITIIDRSRLPISRPSLKRHKSFYRLDIPRFNLNDINPINSILYQASKFEEIITDIKLKFRIKKWSEIWGEINVFEDRDDYGLKPTLLNILNNKGVKNFSIHNHPPHNQIGEKKGEPTKKITLKNSIGINLYINEIRTNTGRDNLILKFLNNDDYQLTPEAKIELIICQLFLYSNENSPSLLIDLIIELYISMITIKENNNHTAIACISLLNQPTNFLHNIFNSSKVNFKKDIYNNTYTTLFFCLLQLTYPNEFPKLKPIVKDLILNKRPIKLSEIYFNFHNEIYDSYGILHQKPLYALIKSTADRRDKKLEDALKSLYRLKYIINTQINIWNLRNDFLLISSKEDEFLNISNLESSCELRDLLLNNIEVSIKDISKLLYEVSWNKQTGNTNNKSLNSEIINVVNGVKINILSKLMLFHGLVYCPVIDGLKRPLREKIDSIYLSISKEDWINDAKEKSKTRFFKNIPKIYIKEEPEAFMLQYRKFKNIWVYFDKNIEELIMNLIINSLQSCRHYTIDDLNYDMKIVISYSMENVKIKFTNYIELPITNGSDFIKKRKELISTIRYELDCDFNKSQTDEEYISEITIPIINNYEEI